MPLLPFEILLLPPANLLVALRLAGPAAAISNHATFPVRLFFTHPAPALLDVAERRLRDRVLRRVRQHPLERFSGLSSEAVPLSVQASVEPTVDIAERQVGGTLVKDGERRVAGDDVIDALGGERNASRADFDDYGIVGLFHDLADDLAAAPQVNLISRERRSQEWNQSENRAVHHILYQPLSTIAPPHSTKILRAPAPTSPPTQPPPLKGGGVSLAVSLSLCGWPSTGRSLESRRLETTRHRVGDALGLLGLALAGLLAVGGAASSTDGFLLGIPSLPWVVVVMALVAMAAKLAPAGPLAAVGLLPLVVALVLGVSLPGLWAWSGPALGVIGAACFLAAMWGPRPKRLAEILFIPVVLVTHLGAAARVQETVGAEGDEPHYLMVAESLLQDGDLALEPDYAEERYAPFYRKPDLAPHYRVRGRDGEILSLHAIGLSLLLLPAYGLGGYPAASFFMALLSVALAVEIRGLIREQTGDSTVADAAAWVAALSPPILHYAGLIFTEIPAALVVAIVLRRGREPWKLSPAAAAGLATACAFLPWLNVRFVPLTIILLLYLAVQPNRKRLVALAAPTLISAAGVAIYHWILYGFWDPRLVYGSRPELSVAALPEGMQGLLLDQEFGLLVYAPAFALAVPGVFFLGRLRRRVTLTSVALVAAVLLTAASWHMWRGGWNPPARFLVPVVAPLVLAIAAAARRVRPAALATLVAWGIWLGVAGAWDPALVHRDRDGTAPFFRAHSGAVEWTTVLPAFVLEEDDRHSLALIWAGLLVFAVWPVRDPRRPGAGSWVLTSAVLVVATGLAHGASDGRSHGRSSARLVGRPALQVPGWKYTSGATARWGTADLGWDGFYEPHRYPDGASVARRLRLPAGVYRLALDIEPLGEPVLPPRLALLSEARGARSEYWPMESAGRLQATFRVPQDHAFSLALVGGSAFQVRTVALAPSTFPGADGLSSQMPEYDRGAMVGSSRR